jgi:hypothetical protein
MNAAQAKKEALRARVNNNVQEILYIREQISKEVQKGRFYVRLYNTKISTETKEVLEKDGYQVVYVDQGRNDFDLLINWQ